MTVRGWSRRAVQAILDALARIYDIWSDAVNLVVDLFVDRAKEIEGTRMVNRANWSHEARANELSVMMAEDGIAAKLGMKAISVEYAPTRPLEAPAFRVVDGMTGAMLWKFSNAREVEAWAHGVKIAYRLRPKLNCYEDGLSCIYRTLHDRKIDPPASIGRPNVIDTIELPGSYTGRGFTMPIRIVRQMEYNDRAFRRYTAAWRGGVEIKAGFRPHNLIGVLLYGTWEVRSVAIARGDGMKVVLEMAGIARVDVDDLDDEFWDDAHEAREAGNRSID